MFGFIKQLFVTLINFSGSLAGMANISNFKTHISLNNLPFITRPSLIDLNLHENNHVLRYYPFTVNLDGCNESCNTLDDWPCRICVPNRTKDIHVNFVNNKNKQIDNVNKTCIMQM